jgi:hypothetical protein
MGVYRLKLQSLLDLPFFDSAGQIEITAASLLKKEKLTDKIYYKKNQKERKKFLIHLIGKMSLLHSI